MAKSPNGLGKFSGKLGGNVFAVRNGQQIVREYNPIVSNPKSPAQLLQRAKGNLVGRISSFTPRTAIVGLGNNNPARRSRFLKLLLRAADATFANGVYTAKVPDDAVVFSEGTTPISVVNPVLTAAMNNITVQLSGLSGSSMSPEVYAASATRLVAMIYDYETRNIVEVVSIMANKPAQGSPLASTIHVATSQSYTALIYAIPMSTSDGTEAAISTSMVSLSDGEIAALLTKNANQVVFNYGHSLLLGEVNFSVEP